MSAMDVVPYQGFTLIVADDGTWGSSKSRRGDVMMPSPLTPSDKATFQYRSTATGPAFAVPTFVSSKEQTSSALDGSETGTSL